MKENLYLNWNREKDAEFASEEVIRNCLCFSDFSAEKKIWISYTIRGSLIESAYYLLMVFVFDVYSQMYFKVKSLDRILSYD